MTTPPANNDLIQRNVMNTPPSSTNQLPFVTMEQKQRTGTIHSTSVNVPKPKAVKISKGCRVSIQRKNPVPILTTNDLTIYNHQISCIPREYPDSAYFYGKVLSGNGNSGYKVEFDNLPTDCNIIPCKRSRLRVLAVGKDEPQLLSQAFCCNSSSRGCTSR